MKTSPISFSGNVHKWSVAGIFIFGTLLAGCTGGSRPGNSETGGNAPAEEQQEAADASDPGGWEVLFDGTSLDQWTTPEGEAIPQKGWIMENGVLMVDSGRTGGDIITRKTYSNFEFKLDFRLTESANSGIKYLVNRMTSTKTGNTSLMGPEYQIIDDFNYEGVKDDPNGLVSTGAVYLLYAPEGKTLNPPGEWNEARIIVRGPHIEHWLNGKKIASYERGSEDFKEKLAPTKFHAFPDYAVADSGHIMLQDHGDRVYFRNIAVRELEP